MDLKPFSPGQPGPTQHLDDASPENLERLRRKAETLLGADTGRLDPLVDRLCAEPPMDRRLLGYPAVASAVESETRGASPQPA